MHPRSASGWTCSSARPQDCLRTQAGQHRRGISKAFCGRLGLELSRPKLLEDVDRCCVLAARLAGVEDPDQGALFAQQLIGIGDDRDQLEIPSGGHLCCIASQVQGGCSCPRCPPSRCSACRRRSAARCGPRRRRGRFTARLAAGVGISVGTWCFKGRAWRRWPAPRVYLRAGGCYRFPTERPGCWCLVAIWLVSGFARICKMRMRQSAPCGNLLVDCQDRHAYCEAKAMWRSRLNLHRA